MRQTWTFKSYSGGGISANGDVTVTSSTISGNSAGFGGGGGIAAGRNVTVTSSTISGNSALGSYGSGGGILTSGDVTVTSSTISGNGASGFGGGIYARGNVTVTVTITNSIVAGNWRTSGTGLPVADDLAGSGIFTLGYSIVGAAVGAINTIPGTINDFGVDPRLGPLANNGGPTQTHSLLPGSPAINGGDPAAVAGMGGVPLYDRTAHRGVAWWADGSTSGPWSRSPIRCRVTTTSTASSMRLTTVCGVIRLVRRPTCGPTAAAMVSSIKRITICGGRISVTRCRCLPASVQC